MRLFITVDLYDNVKATLSEDQKQLAEICGGTPVDSTQLHITLAFLGECEDSAKGPAELVLCRCSSMQIPVVCDLTDYGYFGNENDALIWQGIESRGQLEELAATVREGLTQRNLSYDEKPFVPHISLLKHGNAKALSDVEAINRRFIVESITLYNSELTENGPIYTPLFTSNF